MLTCDFFTSKLILKLIGIQVKFINHFIDRFHVIFQAFFTFFYALIPKHCMKSFYILLSYHHITFHLKICSSILSSKYISLTFHDSMFLTQELFAGLISSKSSLNPSRRIIFPKYFVFAITHFCYESLYMSLHHY